MNILMSHFFENNQNVMAQNEDLNFKVSEMDQRLSEISRKYQLLEELGGNNEARISQLEDNCSELESENRKLQNEHVKQNNQI